MSERIEQLNKLLQADPTDAFCLYALAQEYAAQGAHDRAIEYYGRTLAADAGYLYAYFHQARSQEAMGDLDGARRTLQLGLEQARQAGDPKAESEIAASLEALDGS